MICRNTNAVKDFRHILTSPGYHLLEYAQLYSHLMRFFRSAKFQASLSLPTKVAREGQDDFLHISKRNLADGSVSHGV